MKTEQDVYDYAKQNDIPFDVVDRIKEDVANNDSWYKMVMLFKNGNYTPDREVEATEDLTIDGWVRKEGTGRSSMVQGSGFSLKLSRHAIYKGKSKKWERRRNKHIVCRRLGSTEIRVPRGEWVHVSVSRQNGKETTYINAIKVEGGSE